LDSIEAMAHQRLNHPAEARARVEAAATRLARINPRPDGPRLEGPENFMIAHILHREAKALIEGK
jgi:hypothetical protein